MMCKPTLKSVQQHAVPDWSHDAKLGIFIHWGLYSVNGEAVFGTRPWVTAEGRTTGGVDVRFTRGGESLYATLVDTPQEDWVAIEGLKAVQGSTTALLGHEKPLPWEQRGETLALLLPESVPPAPAYACKIMPSPQPAQALLARSSSLSAGSKLGDIFKDEAGQAVLKRHLGEMLDSSQIEMVMGRSLKQIVQSVPNVLTPEKLDEIDRDLKNVQKKKGQPNDQAR